MDPNVPGHEPKPGVSKLKLALGAASLFLFIVGVKRTFRTDDGRVRLSDEPASEETQRSGAAPGR